MQLDNTSDSDSGDPRFESAQVDQGAGASPRFFIEKRRKRGDLKNFPCGTRLQKRARRRRMCPPEKRHTPVKRRARAFSFFIKTNGDARRFCPFAVQATRHFFFFRRGRAGAFALLRYRLPVISFFPPRQGGRFYPFAIQATRHFFFRRGRAGAFALLRYRLPVIFLIFPPRQGGRICSFAVQATRHFSLFSAAAISPRRLSARPLSPFRARGGAFSFFLFDARQISSKIVMTL